MGIGERIKKRRNELKMSQEELAKRMGYTSRSTIAKIESGANDITQSTIVKFSEVLNTSIKYLMDWEDEDNESINLGKQIRKLRTNKDLSLVEMASEFNISVDDLKQYEKGTKQVPLELLTKMANYFGIEKSDLVEDKLNKEYIKNTNNANVLKLQKRWNDEVGETQFTDDEMTELINFANYLISKRKK